jgi:TonB family protein
VPLVLGFVAVIAVAWGGIRLFTSHPSAPPPTADSAQNSVPEAPVAEQSSSATPPQAATSAPGASVSKSTAASGARPPSHAAVAGKKKPSAVARSSAPPAEASPAGVHEVLPDVPQRARRTIRGTVRVSVRVIIDQDGSVFAALADRRGPSPYFERLAIDAAKKWTFPAAESNAQRLMLVKFDFTRDATTARAVPVK